mmetsp:Transcript_108897/g.249870  ORF Transcript_108897/g.249870 Transcript_108897/m.249870 type:complete len:432 (-) Transcript_108897:12-1307(-)
MGFDCFRVSHEKDGTGTAVYEHAAKWRLNMLTRLECVFAVTYFAEGIQRVGVTYLRTALQHGTGKSMRYIQAANNVLPEFGSALWVLKPAVCFIVETRGVGAGPVMLFAAAVCAACWLALAFSDFSSPETLPLLLTAACSLAAGSVDALVDSSVAKMGRTVDSATSTRYLCERARVAGTILVGCVACFFKLETFSALGIAGCGWVVCTAALLRVKDGCPPCRKQQQKVEVGAQVVLVCCLGIAICGCPTPDLFLYRQKVLGFDASSQTMLSMVSTASWIAGVSFYTSILARGSSWTAVLRGVLLVWILQPLVSTWVVATESINGAIFERAFCDFSKAVTFMPVNVLMQLVSPSGCEGTGFALMQMTGSLASVLGKNFDYQIQVQWGVTPETMHRAVAPIAVAGFLRLGVALCLVLLVIPRLSGAVPFRRED